MRILRALAAALLLLGLAALALIRIIERSERHAAAWAEASRAIQQEATLR